MPDVLLQNSRHPEKDTTAIAVKKAEQLALQHWRKAHPRAHMARHGAHMKRHSAQVWGICDLSEDRDS